MKRKKNSKPRKKARKHRGPQLTPPTRPLRHDRCGTIPRDRGRDVLNRICAEFGLSYRFDPFKTQHVYIEDTESKSPCAVYDAAQGLVALSNGREKYLKRNCLAEALRAVPVLRRTPAGRQYKTGASSLSHWRAKLEASSLRGIVVVEMVESSEPCLLFRRQRDCAIVLTLWPSNPVRIRLFGSTEVEECAVSEVKDILVAQLEYMQLPVVEIGCRVVVDYLDTGDKGVFQIVPQQHNRDGVGAEQFVLARSPLGRAIVGMRCGDSAAVELGGKLQRIRVRVLE